MYIVIGDRLTVALFKLMGFEGTVVEDPKEALAFMAKGIETYDIIFIASKVAKLIRRELDDIRLKNPRKFIVEIPSVEESIEREVNYLWLVRQVLGG
jgi:V/A-type H+-transporting ATPase subunit F